jgi:glyoxylase-like metal-dependent hydrolase (beta-lactamase superfamily II)
MARVERLFDGVRRWTWFSEEKGMDFNGWIIETPDARVWLDPAWGDDELWAELEKVGRPHEILLSNKDHERASAELKKKYGIPVAIHEADAPLLSTPPERTFRDREKLYGVFQVVRFTKLKSPGECAFFWPERRMLFVGDAVTGHPAGKAGLVQKHAGKPEVFEDLKKLLALDFDSLLVGDGEPFVKGGKAALESLLTSKVAA